MYDGNEQRRFLNNIEEYNSCFHITLFGVNNEVVSSGVFPIYTVQGQIYHSVDSLLPTDNKQQSFYKFPVDEK